MTIDEISGTWARAGWREPVNLERRANECLARCHLEMEADQLDALILFREENVHYVSGTRHISGIPSIAFNFPILAVVPRRGAPYVFTTDADGIPLWVDDEHVGGPYFVEERSGLTGFCNRVLDILGDVSGLRIGVDNLSPLAWRLLPTLLSGAELADGQETMMRARRVKTADEIACLIIVEQITAAAMSDVVRAVRPGVTGIELNRIFMSRLTELGCNWPAMENVFCMVPTSHADVPAAKRAALPYRKLTNDVPFRDGDLVVIDGSAQYESYISDFGRTWWCGFEAPPQKKRDLYKAWRDVADAMLEVVKPGATAADVHRAAGRHVTSYVAHSLGHGPEPPIIGGENARLDEEEEQLLEPGMTLVIEPYIWLEGVGGFRAEHVVVITDNGWNGLTRFSHGPLATGCVDGGEL
jgi:Xaa-Pro aminopeptidase